MRRLMLFFAIVYAVEGIGQGRVGIIYQPLSYYLKVTGWTPVDVTAFFALLNFPWVIKPVFGLVSDFVPLLGYRRKSYLILSSLVAVGAYAGIAWLSDAQGSTAVLLVLTAYAMAVSSTLCGALLAENSSSFEEGGALVGQQWLWFNIAVMASALAGGALVELRSPAGAVRWAAAIAAIAPIAVIAGSLLLLDETRARVDRAELKRTLASIVAAVKSRRLWLVAGFLFLYAFAPGFGTPLYYHMTDTLQFSQAYIGMLASIASAGWIAGGLLHRWVLWRIGPKAMLYLGIVLGTLATAAFLLLEGELSAALVNFASGVAAMIATIASLTLAAHYCPTRAEGFAFAGLMSVMNLADVASSNVGAFLYERVFGNQLAPLIIVSAATTALAAVLVPLLRLERETE